MTSIAIVGKKGEIVIKKKEREKANIKPGDKVIILGRKKGEIIIKKIPSIEELLERKANVPPLDLEEWEKERRKLRKEFMRNADEKTSTT